MSTSLIRELLEVIETDPSDLASLEQDAFEAQRSQAIKRARAFLNPTPDNPMAKWPFPQSATPVWLMIASGDSCHQGLCSSQAEVHRWIAEAVFGSFKDAMQDGHKEELARYMEDFCNPDEWDAAGQWSGLTFEDGDISAIRLQVNVAPPAYSEFIARQFMPPTRPPSGPQE